MSRASETRIQGHILAQLSVEPGCAVLMPDGKKHGDPYPRAVFWRQNTGAARTGDRVVRFGIPGQADITGVIAGRRIEIECKSPTGRQSPEQRAFQLRVESAGGLYLIAHSVKDVLVPVRALIEGWL